MSPERTLANFTLSAWTVMVLGMVGTYSTTNLDQRWWGLGDIGALLIFAFGLWFSIRGTKFTVSKLVLFSLIGGGLFFVGALVIQFFVGCRLDSC